MTSKDIVFFGGIDSIDKRKLPVHHVVERLAVKNRVFYVDNFGGLRPLNIKDLPRAIRKLRNGLRRPRGRTLHSKEFESTFEVYQPLTVPLPRLGGPINRLNIALLRRGLRRLYAHYRIHSPVIWTRVPTEVVWHGISGLPRSLLVYQSVDQISSSPMVAEYVRPRLKRYEQLFSRAADIVFASAMGLYQEKKRINPRTFFFPNGVDPELFRRAHRKVERLEMTKRPIIGYMGSLGPWVDFELVRKAALEMPDWSYVLLGPVNPGVDLRNLDELPNVHLLDSIEHAEIPDYLNYFDCALIPYLINDFTAYTFPSKLAEYLVAGLPIVSTPLPEMEPYVHVVSIIRNHHEMNNAIRRHLSNSHKELASQRRVDVGRTLSWDSIVSRMDEEIERSLHE